MRFYEQSNHQSGLSFLEVMIVLAVLSLSATLFMTVDRLPSRSFQFERLAAEVKARAAAVRNGAVVDGTQRAFDLGPYSCDTMSSAIMFSTDGTASTGSACFEIDGLRATMDMDPITGLFGSLVRQ